MKIQKGYKKTEIGIIPEEWEVVRIKDIFFVLTGTTPSTKIYEYWNPEEINWITPADLSFLEQHNTIIESQRKISKKAVKRYNLNILEPDSLILSTRAPVGYVALVKQRATFNQGCKGLVPKIALSSLFYLYLLKRLKPELERLSGGSTFKELRKQYIENLTVPLPPLPEQRKIAEILGSVDEAIEITDKEIEKVERLKKGLMQELLIKGIGHKKFKKTEIGIIPEEWEVVRIGNIGNVVTGTTPSTKIIEYWGTDIPFVTPSDFKKTKYVKFTERKVSKTGAKIGKLIPPKSVMVVCIASVGEVSLASSMCITNQQINSIVCKKNIDPEYIYYVLSGRKGILQSWAGITTTPIIKKSLFEKFPIPLPPLPEQRKIAEILSGVDELLETLRSRKEKLQRLKKGLMEDLLTGKRRVKINGNA